jgi:predicted NBD/HSP70 family sugar kinase
VAYIASHLKGLNRKTVYQLLQSKGELSKADISRQTGISAPTVIKIIDYFKEIGCVEELGEGETSLGRKPQMLRFNPQAGYAIGVEYSGVEIKMGIVDFAGNLCFSNMVATAPDFKKVIGEELFYRIEELIKESQIPLEKIKGVCIGVPGVVNKVQKIIDLAPLVGVNECINYGNIFDDLSIRLKMPVFVENDANAAAMGEFICRGFVSNEDLLFIIIGKGLGAGIILDGKLRKGNNFSAGEIGYMVFNKNFMVSKQSAGWLEKELRLDDLRNEEMIISSEYLDDFAANLALAMVNIFVPLEINHMVLGRVKDKNFDAALIEKINGYLEAISIMNIKCSLPVCEEPGIVGCANIVIESVLKRMLTE